MRFPMADRDYCFVECRCTLKPCNIYPDEGGQPIILPYRTQPIGNNVPRDDIHPELWYAQETTCRFDYTESSKRNSKVRFLPECDLSVDGVV